MKLKRLFGLFSSTIFVAIWSAWKCWASKQHSHQHGQTSSSSRCMACHWSADICCYTSTCKTPVHEVGQYSCVVVIGIIETSILRSIHSVSCCAFQSNRFLLDFLRFSIQRKYSKMIINSIFILLTIAMIVNPIFTVSGWVVFRLHKDVHFFTFFFFVVISKCRMCAIILISGTTAPQNIHINVR